MNRNTIKTQALELGRNFYFAGLGITSLVTDRAGKTFDALVEKGQTRSDEGEKEVKTAREGLTQRVKDLSDKAGDRIQEGVQATFGRLGIPSRTEIKELTESIEQLSNKIQGMQANKA
jgi:poly(hydroxyalkanoate) granule-associated protein